jgi:hypothetical protein
MPYVLFAALFAASWAVLETGYRIAARTRINDDEHYHEQIINLRDSLMVLLGLLIGFTFAMAVSRFEQRRQLGIDEANAIGTMILRVRTLPEPVQSAVAPLARQYAAVRADFAGADLRSSQEQDAVRRSNELQKELWERVLAAPQQDRTNIFGLFLQSVNEVIDLSEKRLAAREDRIPAVIWTLLTLIALLAAFTTGYGLSKRFWFPAIMMPLMFAAAVALIADLDSPTRGLIHPGHNSMVRLMEGLKK